MGFVQVENETNFENKQGITKNCSRQEHNQFTI